MSSRMTNELTIFMCLMNWILKLFLDSFVIIIIQDILVNSKSREEYVGPLCILKDSKGEAIVC